MILKIFIVLKDKNQQIKTTIIRLNCIIGVLNPIIIIIIFLI